MYDLVFEGPFLSSSLFFSCIMYYFTTFHTQLTVFSCLNYYFDKKLLNSLIIIVSAFLCIIKYIKCDVTHALIPHLSQTVTLSQIPFPLQRDILYGWPRIIIT